ncbi:unnamed protein product [Toxocara canis]|uniref:Serpentine receptor class gamma n=1 Tax=Toxocara canis TaxID=6265 RepID=A0A183VE33_TOXCA|nr:unnamed protein product [Toxocara canis]
MYFEFNVFMRARKYGYLNFLCLAADRDNHGILARIATGVHYYIKLVSYSGHVAVAANRLSAVIAPLQYEMIWTQIRLRVFWALQWSLPIAIILPVVCDVKREIRTVYQTSRSQLRIVFDKTTFEIMNTIDVSCCLLATVACAVLYTAIFLRTYRRRCAAATHYAWLGELRLIIATFTVYLIMILDMIAQLLILIFSSNGDLDSALAINDYTYVFVKFAN